MTTTINKEADVRVISDKDDTSWHTEQAVNLQDIKKETVETDIPKTWSNKHYGLPGLIKLNLINDLPLAVGSQNIVERNISHEIIGEKVGQFNKTFFSNGNLTLISDIEGNSISKHENNCQEFQRKQDSCTVNISKSSMYKETGQSKSLNINLANISPPAVGCEGQAGENSVNGNTTNGYASYENKSNKFVGQTKIITISDDEDESIPSTQTIAQDIALQSDKKENILLELVKINVFNCSPSVKGVKKTIETEAYRNTSCEIKREPEDISVNFTALDNIEIGLLDATKSKHLNISPLVENTYNENAAADHATQITHTATKMILINDDKDGSEPFLNTVNILKIKKENEDFSTNIPPQPVCKDTELSRLIKLNIPNHSTPAKDVKSLIDRNTYRDNAASNTVGQSYSKKKLSVSSISKAENFPKLQGNFYKIKTEPEVLLVHESNVDFANIPQQFPIAHTVNAHELKEGNVSVLSKTIQNNALNISSPDGGFQSTTYHENAVCSKTKCNSVSEDKDINTPVRLANKCHKVNNELADMFPPTFERASNVETCRPDTFNHLSTAAPGEILKDVIKVKQEPVIVEENNSEDTSAKKPNVSNDFVDEIHTDTINHKNTCTITNIGKTNIFNNTKDNHQVNRLFQEDTSVKIKQEKQNNFANSEQHPDILYHPYLYSKSEIIKSVKSSKVVKIQQQYHEVKCETDVRQAKTLHTQVGNLLQHADNQEYVPDVANDLLLTKTTILPGNMVPGAPELLNVSNHGEGSRYSRDIMQKDKTCVIEKSNTGYTKNSDILTLNGIDKTELSNNTIDVEQVQIPAEATNGKNPAHSIVGGPIKCKVPITNYLLQQFSKAPTNPPLKKRSKAEYSHLPQNSRRFMAFSSAESNIVNSTNIESNNPGETDRTNCSRYLVDKGRPNDDTTQSQAGGKDESDKTISRSAETNLKCLKKTADLSSLRHKAFISKKSQTVYEEPLERIHTEKSSAPDLKNKLSTFSASHSKEELLRELCQIFKKIEENNLTTTDMIHKLESDHSKCRQTFQQVVESIKCKSNVPHANKFSSHKDQTDVGRKRIYTTKADNDKAALKKARLDNKDPTNEEWTLKHRQLKKGLVELMPRRGIYVDAVEFKNCMNYRNLFIFISKLLVAVFSREALTECSFGAKVHSLEEPRRKFDKKAIKAIIDYVRTNVPRRHWKSPEGIDFLHMVLGKAIAQLRNRYGQIPHK